MVAIRILFTFLAFMLFSSLQQPQINLPAKVSVEFSQGAFENQAISVTLKIIRLNSQKINMASFTLQDKPLSVVFMDEQWPGGKPVGPDDDVLVVSTFEFTLPPQARGLYVLPSVRVEVGGVIVSAPSISYEVIGSYMSQELMLEARVVPPGPVYPGQKVTFEYRITFQQPIQLTKEELPLLEFPGFRNVGAPRIVNVPSGNLTAQIISQDAIAGTVGMQRTGISFLEGYVYSTDFSGNRVTIPPLLRAQAPEISLEVLPFPAEGKPSSFNGAVGIFHWQVKLVGSSSVRAGEKLQLEVLVSGQGDFDSLQMPDLRMQKGFKDNFLLSDIAPLAEKQDDRVRFILELRPVRQEIKEIPSIQFASFDPNSKTYVVEKTDPISISVLASGSSQKRSQRIETAPQLGGIEIQANVMLDQSRIKTERLALILVVYALISFTLLYGMQLIMRRLMRESKEKAGMSREVFLQAIKAKNSPEECYRLLREALLLALFEAKITNEIVSHPEQLTTEGLQGEVRAFLTAIDQKRFTGLETQVDINDSINEATLLYHRVKK